MAILRSAGNKKGIYSVFTTVILIITILGCVGILFYLNNSVLFINEQKNIGIQEKQEFRSVRDRMFYCYGNVIDTDLAIADLDCMNLGEKGISVTKLEYEECEPGTVAGLNYRGIGRIEHHHIPIYGERRNGCPAILSIYETGIEVPVILSTSIQPEVAVQGTLIDYHVDFQHATAPSQIILEVMDGDTQLLELASGPLNVEQVDFSIDSTTLAPGLYTTTVTATKDGTFSDVWDPADLFRVVDATDAPVINSVTIDPQQGSVFDNFQITASLTDYLTIQDVRLIISQGGVDLENVILTQTSNLTDPIELIIDYNYAGSWNPGVPNQDAVYDVRLVATNELGNSVEFAAGQITIIEVQYTGLVIIATNNRVANALGGQLDDYIDALESDGYLGRVVRLDSNDVTACNPALSPAGGPIVSADDAVLIIPQCIVAFEADASAQMLPGSSSYVLILGGQDQVEQSYGGSIASQRGEPYHTSDFFADLNGDLLPDRPIGRLPDAIPPGDDSISIALDYAIQYHENQGWAKGGSRYGWTCDVPKGVGSPTNEHIECITNAMGGPTTCGADPECYFSPPYGAPNIPPPNWQSATDMLYICGHGNGNGMQRVVNHYYNAAGQNVGSELMIVPSTLGNRDFENTILFYNPCYGGRIHNVRPNDLTLDTPFPVSYSAVMQSLRQGAVAVFAGTNTQTFQPLPTPCQGLPVTNSLGTGSTFLTNLAYEVNQQSYKTVGDAWLATKLTVTNKRQREQNSMYGDPSIRVK